MNWICVGIKYLIYLIKVIKGAFYVKCISRGFKPSAEYIFSKDVLDSIDSI